MREVQEEWEVKLRRGLNTLCTELGVPLAREVCRGVCVCVGGGEVCWALSLGEEMEGEGKV